MTHCNDKVPQIVDALLGDPTRFGAFFPAADGAWMTICRVGEILLDIDLFRGRRRISLYLPPELSVVDLTTPVARAYYSLPASIVGDAGGPAEFRRFQAAVANVRQGLGFVGPIVMASASLHDVRTVVLGHDLAAATHPIPGRSREHAIPTEVIEHALGRRQLPDDYDIASDLLL